MTRWYYSRHGRAFGPVTPDQLRDLVRQGHLRPDDLVACQGATAWSPAGSVLGLFPAPAPAPASPPDGAPAGETPWWYAAPAPAAPAPAPVAVAPPGPAAPEKKSSWIVSFLLALPKPLLFALFGGAGGLLGALPLGELLWLLLSPSGLPAGPPLQVAAPASVQVYAGGKNRFLVRVARQGFTGAVRVEAPAPPDGVTVPPVEIAAGEDQAEVEARASDQAPRGSFPLTLQARPLARASIAPVSAGMQVLVEAVPPGLAVAASPRVSVYQGDKGRFTVRVARSRFQEDVTVRFQGLPEGVPLPEVVVPANRTDATAEVSPPLTAPVGESPVTVEATSRANGQKVAGTAAFVLDVQKRPPPTADVLFVLDLTGSMQFAIDGIKKGIQGFVEAAQKEKLDARIGLVGFRDIVDDKERPFVLQFGGGTFTQDCRAFQEKLGPLRARGGGDEPESSLQALALAARQPFRPRAARVLVLITDAPPKVHPGERPSTVAETVDELTRREITQLHFVARRRDVDGPYQGLRERFPGSFFEIQMATRGDAFAELLPSLSKAISLTTVSAAPKAAAQPEPPPLPEERATRFPPPPDVPVLQAVQSSQAFAADDRSRLLLAIVVWTMVLAGAISLSLVAGQHFHTRQARLGPWAGGRAVAGGLLAGLVGGAVGQLVFQSTSGALAWGWVSRVLGWGFLGGLAGIVLALFVPNLKWWRGLLGGLAGGALGAGAFLLAGVLLGSLLGRWLGAGVLGFCIGLMVALAELAFRRWWLEVAVSPREVRTVTLGAAAVSLGGDERLASFYVAGAPAVALRYWVEKGRVLCADATTGQTTEAPPGDRRTVGRVAVTVCSPASTKKTGYVLSLSGGRALLLREGMPLTADDLPGLEAQGADGTVALVSRPPDRARGVVLRNRSRQRWAARKPDGTTQAVDPGRGVELCSGLGLNFGQAQGTVLAEEAVRL
jgi:Mg-chelatase subunit ChlD